METYQQTCKMVAAIISHHKGRNCTDCFESIIGFKMLEHCSVSNYFKSLKSSHFPSLQNFISSSIDANLGQSRQPLITYCSLPSYILQSVLLPALYLILASIQCDILLPYNISKYKNHSSNPVSVEDDALFVLYLLYISPQ
jgi:hypothetical protein